MKPDYDRVKYYSDSDISLQFEFRKAKALADAFDESKVCCDINDVLELYNVYRIIVSPGIEAEYRLQYKTKSNLMIAVIARFFSTIADDNIIDIHRAVRYDYTEDFWRLIDKFRVYERISDGKFKDVLNNQGITLYIILKEKKIVMHYDTVLADYMRQSDQSARILVSKFLEKREHDTDQIELPSSLHPDEYEPILQKYIESRHFV